MNKSINIIALIFMHASLLFSMQKGGPSAPIFIVAANSSSPNNSPYGSPIPIASAALPIAHEAPRTNKCIKCNIQAPRLTRPEVCGHGYCDGCLPQNGECSVCQESDCGICLMPMEKTATRDDARFLICKHAFHHECIARWGKDCPMCRGPLVFVTQVKCIICRKLFENRASFNIFDCKALGCKKIPQGNFYRHNSCEVRYFREGVYADPALQYKPVVRCPLEGDAHKIQLRDDAFEGLTTEPIGDAYRTAEEIGIVGSECTAHACVHEQGRIFSAKHTVSHVYCKFIHIGEWTLLGPRSTEIEETNWMHVKCHNEHIRKNMHGGTKYACPKHGKEHWLYLDPGKCVYES